MFLNLFWQPAEDDSTIINERSWLVGTILAAVAYGIVFTLFVLTFKQLIRTTTKYNYSQRLFFIIYITVMLILGTLYVGSIARMTELGFIDYRLYPGGPAAFQQMEFSSPVGEISNASFVIANWLAGGMMIYRYLVIFRSIRQCRLLVVMLLPLLGYIASFSLSVAWFIQISIPVSSPRIMAGGAINFTTPYYLLSLSFNISMTIAICARLLFYRRRIVSILGPNHGTPYTSMAAVLVDSASLSSVFALLFFIPFALDKPIQNVFIRLQGEVQIIASLLIIYRVAYGAAWASETSQSMFGTKETENFEGIRVQIRFSSNHCDEKESIPSSRLDGGQDGEDKMQNFTGYPSIASVISCM